MSHVINDLKEQMLAISTKAFNARGSIVSRCSKCLLAEFACMCPWQLKAKSAIHFIILFHRNELFKTTNTGRLVAELFPDSTSAYLWSRTEPDPRLLSRINDKTSATVLLFPDKNTDACKLDAIQTQPTPPLGDNKPLNIILLDGTWKQAARMANLSPWLQHIPRLEIKTNSITKDSHYIRKAQQAHQLSTAQAAAMALGQLGETDNAELLEHYFSVFNQHCLSTRSNIPPSMTDSHDFLSKAKHHATD